MAKARATDAAKSAAGLCGTCAHATHQASARGGSFWRCRRADSDPAYPRYPPLPVRSCPGHRPAGRACEERA